MSFAITDTLVLEQNLDVAACKFVYQTTETAPLLSTYLHETPSLLGASCLGGVLAARKALVNL